MISVAIKDKYAETLTTFGELETTIDEALQKFSIEQIGHRIIELARLEARYQTKYGMNFEQFSQRLATEEGFAGWVEANVEKLWEADLIDWEFCHEGIQDWKRQLDTVLLS